MSLLEPLAVGGSCDEWTKEKDDYARKIGVQWIVAVCAGHSQSRRDVCAGLAHAAWPDVDALPDVGVVVDVGRLVHARHALEGLRGVGGQDRDHRQIGIRHDDDGPAVADFLGHSLLADDGGRRLAGRPALRELARTEERHRARLGLVDARGRSCRCRRVAAQLAANPGRNLGGRARCGG